MDMKENFFTIFSDMKRLVESTGRLLDMTKAFHQVHLGKL